jgi:hypothetical protein
MMRQNTIHQYIEVEVCVFVCEGFARLREDLAS